MLKKYSKEIEDKMKKHYNGLNEKEKRHYAAIESIKLEHGGKIYISNILNCCLKTIRKGIKEINNNEVLLNGKIRKAGGGRKNIIETNPNIEIMFVRIIGKYTAGNPMNEDIWTHLKPKEIVEFISKEGITTSIYIVKQLLEKSGYKYRKMQKKVIMSESENREEQFLKIEELKLDYKKSDNPIISIDVKKKN